MSNYLVTGCAGFIGSHLVEALLQRGDHVIGVDCLTDYYPLSTKESNLEAFNNHRRFEFIQADLTDIELEPLLATVDGVFHLAAQPGVRGSWGDTFGIYLHDNLMATQKIFEAACAVGTRVVFASSSSVYGNAESYPTRETDIAAPISPYGVTKLTCEYLAHGYSCSASLDFVALRYFTVYGPRQRPDMAFTRIFTALVAGDRFEIYGDGGQTRDVTYVGDAVQATLASMLGAPTGAIYNVAGGSETSLVDVIDACERFSGERLDAHFGPQVRGDVRRTAGDIALIRRDLGWSPQTSLEDGLRAHLEWCAARVPLVTRDAA